MPKSPQVDGGNERVSATGYQRQLPSLGDRLGRAVSVPFCPTSILKKGFLMYTVIKTLEIAGAHTLNLPYDSPCGRLHGHNWTIEVEVNSVKLNAEGMVIDFTLISEVVKRLDHALLNTLTCPNCMHITEGILPALLNPTAENIAKWIADELTSILDDKLKTKITIRLMDEGEEGMAGVCAAYKDGEVNWEEDVDEDELVSTFNEIVQEQMDEEFRPRISKVVVVESKGNIACYTP